MSEIVTLNVVESTIAVITLADQENHNQFSPALYQALNSKLQEAQQNKNVRVILIQGNALNFSHGMKVGSAEPHLEIEMYALLLNSELPIISVMQGEAHDAGFALWKAWRGLLILPMSVS